MDHSPPDHITRIAMIGSGSWATALVKILCEGNVQINWWLRQQVDIQHIKKYHINPRYLSSVRLDLQKVHPMSDLKAAIRDAEFVILAVPAAFLPDALAQVQPQDFAGKKVVSAVKGMIVSRNCSVAEYVIAHLGVSPAQVCVIAGPCHAEEVAMEKQSYLTIAGEGADTATQLSRLLRCRYIQATPYEDMHGVEYCAVMKNIIAIASGIARGLNYGDNFQAVLVSNSTEEIRAFLDAVYPLERRLNKSAYLGDLLVTAYSQFSRNRTFGNMLGRGYSVKAAQIEMNMVAEGFYAVKSIHAISLERQIQMPITHAVYNVIYEKISPVIEFKILEGLLH